MFEKENTERKDSRELMQLAQDKGPAQLDRQLQTPLPRSLGMKATDRGRQVV
jgi:hypothetical protein